jgi:hypothetical protein
MSVRPRSRKMRESEKALRLERMQAVLATLRYLQSNNIPEPYPTPGQFLRCLFAVRNMLEGWTTKTAEEQSRIIALVCSRALPSRPTRF